MVHGLGDDRDCPLGCTPAHRGGHGVGEFHPPTHRTGMILLVEPIRYHRGSLSQRSPISQVDQRFGRPDWWGYLVWFQ